jgi:hypothetical protein
MLRCEVSLPKTGLSVLVSSWTCETVRRGLDHGSLAMAWSTVLEDSGSGAGQFSSDLPGAFYWPTPLSDEESPAYNSLKLRRRTTAQNLGFHNPFGDAGRDVKS